MDVDTTNTYLFVCAQIANVPVWASMSTKTLEVNTNTWRTTNNFWNTPWNVGGCRYIPGNLNQLIFLNRRSSRYYLG